VLCVALACVYLYIHYNSCWVLMSDIIRIVSIHNYHLSLFLLLQKFSIPRGQQILQSYHSAYYANKTLHKAFLIRLIFLMAVQ
jgi:hypothetical protein